MIINDTPTGTLAHGGNELNVDAKNDDPAAVRGGRKYPGIIIKLSGDFYVDDPTPEEPFRKLRFERGFFSLGTDDSGGLGGKVTIQLVEPGKHGDEFTRKIFEVDTRQILCHVPLVALAGIFDTERQWPWENSDRTHGIPAGDFAAIVVAYGFASDDEAPYREGRKTWIQVIAEMDRRDDYRHFPVPAPPGPFPLPLPLPSLPPEEIAERELDVGAARQEFIDVVLDEGGVQSYLDGRKELTEFHNDEQRRAGYCRPEFHRPGRPY